MFGSPQRERIALRHARRIVACALLAVGAGCGGGGDGQQQPPPDLSGVWAGAWQGTDPTAGSELVSGTWEVEIAQGETSASGAALLLGDIDCMNGQMQTDPGAQTAVTGSLSRPGCALISWLLTAINVSEGKASGSWSNFGTGGSGTLSGDRIARLGGPRIRFVHPPGGKPGAIVTVGGSMLSGLAPADGLMFNFSAQSTPLSADATRIVARVPGFVSSGPIKVRTGAGTALSPRPFNTDVISPPVILGRSSAPGIAPAALAVSPDGRKFYIADRGSSSVRIVRTSTLTNLFTAPIVGVPRSVVASPDGQRIYVASANVGVLVLDAASAFGIGTISLTSINDGGRDNPQGLAISPDGTLLVVSEGSNGGSARLFRISDQQLLWSTPIAADMAPLGVAFSPDGTRIYVAVADLTPGAGSLQVFDVDSGALLDSEPVGDLPTALAVTPDGNLVFVTNKDSGTVSVYNTSSEMVVSTVTVGTGPAGIAISPDGARVYVANRGSNSVSVFDALIGTAVAASPLDLSGVAMEPIAVAMHPAGTLAYVSHVTTNPVIVEIGSMQTLTIARGGSGIGTVRSDIPGIDCGTQCQAQYPFGTSVTLTAVPNSNSTFSHWSGSAGCAGVVTLNTNLSCVANFNSKAPPPSSSSSPSSGGCFIATAAYGSDMADDVMTLRRFRDGTLLHSAAGREFVRLYYRHSPPLADYIRERDTLRAAVRGALWPLVFAIKHPALALASILAMLMLVLGWRQARAGR